MARSMQEALAALETWQPDLSLSIMTIAQYNAVNS